MKRRQEITPTADPSDLLMDSSSWPLCPRFDGASQPCLCWFGEQQRKMFEAGDWPGDDVGFLADWLTATAQHDCRASFDGSAV